jgi:hypothetical protein
LKIPFQTICPSKNPFLTGFFGGKGFFKGLYLFPFSLLAMKNSLIPIPFLILVTVVGCGDGDKPKYANVKGKVTFNGKPIEKGQIIFAMDGRAPSTMQIVDGEFNGQAMVGTNRISISAMKKTANAAKLSKAAQIQIKGYQQKFKDQPNQGGGTISDYDPMSVDYIPPEWGSKSKETRVIEAGQTNEIEIHIKG